MLTAQERTTIKKQIQTNKHEVFIVSLEEMDAIVKSSPQGKRADIQQRWQQIKAKAEFAANYYPTADDIRTIAKLIGDLGSVGAQAYVKTYGGKPHVILKGNPSLRKILTGTKYGVNHPKVVTMGIGKAGAIHAAKTGGILSVVLLSSYRLIDYFLTDQATLSQLIGSLATDVVKVGIATGASIAAASGLLARYRFCDQAHRCGSRGGLPYLYRTDLDRREVWNYKPCHRRPRRNERNHRGACCAHEATTETNGK